MNTLTVNLHLMLATFYRPEPRRFRVIVGHAAFPSDRYAVRSQIESKGYDPDDAIVTATPRSGEQALRTEDMIELIDRHRTAGTLNRPGQIQRLDIAGEGAAGRSERKHRDAD